MLSNLLKQSRYTVVFSGAGMSTESGIPDFRSASGLWKGRDPQKLASVGAMKNHRDDFVKFYKTRIEQLQKVTPHNGYEILAKWGEKGLVQSVITQNTDGLHEQTTNVPVYPIHGTIQQLHCQRCQRQYEATTYLQGVFSCSCGGFLRPSVILFGEMLDEQLLQEAMNEAQKAELFIVLGSSLVVSPANAFPKIAKDAGAKLVIINNDPTPLDVYADIIVNNRKIGEVLKEIDAQLLA